MIVSSTYNMPIIKLPLLIAIDVIYPGNIYPVLLYRLFTVHNWLLEAGGNLELSEDFLQILETSIQKAM